ncbi:hypothetical protein [Spongiactinospora sp. TRM90649]|uniref:hypothetical protein n=1 Tax=Spongiactinospora sp. TRM90649 TaxID=3031114 RepID=UPI0023F9BDFC|nr:hypothetical protein [Spongiactinospora sp. TRM90649]MDF5758583.1 hypothetical protein [Spongiactinospora sp. TRM90649]
MSAIPFPAAALRATQDALADAERALVSARTGLDTATAVYDSRRSDSPSGIETCTAHTAWTIALREWTHALIAREAAKDAAAGEQRSADRGGPQDPTATWRA